MDDHPVLLVIIGVIISGEFLPSMLSFELFLHFKRQLMHFNALVVFNIATQLLKSAKKWRLRVPLVNVILIRLRHLNYFLTRPRILSHLPSWLVIVVKRLHSD